MPRPPPSGDPGPSGPARSSLVVRGAGAAARSGFPIPLSIRTCGLGLDQLPGRNTATAYLRPPSHGAAAGHMAGTARPNYPGQPQLTVLGGQAPVVDGRASFGKVTPSHTRA